MAWLTPVAYYATYYYIQDTRKNNSKYAHDFCIFVVKNITHDSRDKKHKMQYTAQIVKRLE